MKKKLKSLLSVLLVICVLFIFTSCNKDKKEPALENKSWPTSTFIVNNTEYKGKGKIEYSESGSEASSVYISNADLESVKEYINELKDNGILKASEKTEEQTEFSKDGTFSWVGANSENTFCISIMLVREELTTTDANNKEFLYNLAIVMNNYNIYK